MLYLSKLTLHPRSPQARGDLSDCRALHQRILSAFPDMPEISAACQHYGVLYRVEVLNSGTQVLVQSQAVPDWSRLPSGYLREPATAAKSLDSLYAAIEIGQPLRFRIKANPTRRINDRNEKQPERWRGKRVELRTEKDQCEWLARKAEAAGFTLVTVRAALYSSAVPTRSEIPDVRATQTAARVTGRREGQRLTFGSVLFEGNLKVTDADAFREALANGIGSGKAFGFGLLSVGTTTR
jgi:CRISPR system Cascade subunit CasE